MKFAHVVFLHEMAEFCKFSSTNSLLQTLNYAFQVYLVQANGPNWNSKAGIDKEIRERIFCQVLCGCINRQKCTVKNIRTRKDASVMKSYMQQGLEGVNVHGIKILAIARKLAQKMKISEEAMGGCCYSAINTDFLM